MNTCHRIRQVLAYGPATAGEIAVEIGKDINTVCASIGQLTARRHTEIAGEIEHPSWQWGRRKIKLYKLTPTGRGMVRKVEK